MNRRSLLKSLLLMGAATSFTKNSLAFPIYRLQYRIHFLRHATLVLQLGNTKFLIDPMLAEKGAMDPVGNAANQDRIPLVDLPMNPRPLKRMLSKVDAVVVTHTHRDHWDQVAQDMIPKNKPILCQPSDAETIRKQGFTQVIPIEDTLTWHGIEICRTNGQHGTGEIGRQMGNVSGFVFKRKFGSVYVAGDTIWCEDVQKALVKHQPTATILNAGAAQFLTGDPITMTAEDVCKVYRQLPDTQVIVVHMETVNHCLLTRKELLAKLEAEKLNDYIFIPEDGGKISAKIDIGSY